METSQQEPTREDPTQYNIRPPRTKTKTTRHQTIKTLEKIQLLIKPINTRNPQKVTTIKRSSGVQAPTRINMVFSIPCTLPRQNDPPETSTYTHTTHYTNAKNWRRQNVSTRQDTTVAHSTPDTNPCQAEGTKWDYGHPAIK